MRTLLTDLRGNPIPIADRRSIPRHNQTKTTLMRYVETRAWNDVVRRARSHGQEVWKIDEQGNTALHHACKFDPPIAVIRALGASVSASNANGLTPLHVAASHRCNARTLKALVELRPASLRTPSRRERTPMHYACLSFRGLDFDAFETLLEASLQEQSQTTEEEDDEYDDICNDEVDDNGKKGIVLTWKDSTGGTPLGLLFRRYRERVKSAICRLNQQDQQEDATLLQSDLGQLWGKARLIVAKLTEERLHREGSLLNTEDDSSLAWAVEHHLLGECKFRIVHASVGLVGYGCPPELIRLAIAMHPQQVREMDEDGNLPIHIAATASSSGSAAESNANHGSGGADDDSSVYSLTSFFSSSTTNASPHAFDKVIQILLRNYPEAAYIPHGKSGRLPLVLAIRGGERTWEDGIQTLVTANPAALHSAKLQKAYPEGIALVGGGGHPPTHPKKGEKEGGLRIFQNLYLLALHNRNNHGSGGGAGGRRGTAARKPRKHRSLTSSSHGGGGSKKASKGNKSLPPNPRTLTNMFQLLKSKPDLVDREKYRNLTN
mmetsp:Transcript_79825/g.222080  ORF Transcript_79825/g.222080 Transcript_79825/m.222080 type:complete len:549 (+) Transcript_79825:76-1722(+)